jgi:hypothetical protein
MIDEYSLHAWRRVAPLLLPDVHVHFLAWINRRILLPEAENHGQHPQIHLFLTFI